MRELCSDRHSFVAVFNARGQNHLRVLDSLPVRLTLMIEISIALCGGSSGTQVPDVVGSLRCSGLGPDPARLKDLVYGQGSSTQKNISNSNNTIKMVAHTLS